MPETGQTVAHFTILEKLGEGGPPPPLDSRSGLRRGLAEAKTRSGQ